MIYQSALRQRLVKDANRFVGQQRINCLLEGAWFKLVTSYYKLSLRIFICMMKEMRRKVEIV